MRQTFYFGVFLLLFLCRTGSATEDFQLTDVEFNLWGTDDDAVGTWGLDLAAVSESGAVLTLSDVAGIGTTSNYESLNFAIYGSGIPDRNLDEGYRHSLRYPEITVAGASFDPSVITGSFKIVAPTIQSSIVIPADLSGEWFELVQTDEVADVRVTFTVDFQIFDDAIDNEPAYRVIGQGSGKGTARFSTWHPSHNQVLQTAGIYTFTVETVPEPSSPVIWGMFLLIHVFRTSQQAET